MIKKVNAQTNFMQLLRWFKIERHIIQFFRNLTTSRVDLLSANKKHSKKYKSLNVKV